MSLLNDKKTHLSPLFSFLPQAFTPIVRSSSRWTISVPLAYLVALSHQPGAHRVPCAGPARTGGTLSRSGAGALLQGLRVWFGSVLCGVYGGGPSENKKSPQCGSNFAPLPFTIYSADGRSASSGARVQPRGHPATDVNRVRVCVRWCVVATPSRTMKSRRVRLARLSLRSAIRA